MRTIRTNRWIGIALALTCATTASVIADSPNSEIPLFSRDVAPILYNNCASCHRPDGSGPFPLLQYQDVRKRARQMVDVIRSGFMPPWLPEPGYGEFVGERRLTDAEIETISAWVEGGTREGDAADSRPVPVWNGGWRLGQPDIVLKPDQPYTLRADGEDVFRNFVMPIPVTATRYVRAIELRSGNPRIVHHAIMRIDETRSSQLQAAKNSEGGFGDMNMGDAVAPDNFLLAWTPGHQPDPGRDGYAWTLRPYTDFVLQLHMQPSGKPEMLDIEVGLYFDEIPPVHRVGQIILRARSIDIPAGEPNHVIEDVYTIPVDVNVLSIYPHAHYLGKRYDCWAELPDGSTQWMVKINDWDFAWQDEYRYLEPVRLPEGTRLHMKIAYDNTVDNVRNPNHPPKRVQGGSRSEDEMATMTLQVAPDNLADLNALQDSLVRQDIEKDPSDWLAHVNLAMSAQQAGRLDEAALHYLETSKLNPTHTTAFNNLAIVREQQGRIDDAVSLLTRALQINPDYADAHSNLARLRQMQGDSRTAAQHYEKALELNPGNAAAHFNFGTLLLSGNMLDEAESQLSEAFQLEPQNAEFCNALGNLHAARRDLPNAEKFYRRALELSPDLAEAHGNLGNVLMQLPRVAAAVVQFRRALELRPELDGTRADLENALALQAEIEAAIASAVQAVEQSGGRNVGTLMSLADTYASAGQIDDALATAQRALTLAREAGVQDLEPRIQARMQLYRDLAP